VKRYRIQLTECFGNITIIDLIKNQIVNYLTFHQFIDSEFLPTKQIGTFSIGRGEVDTAGPRPYKIRIETDQCYSLVHPQSQPVHFNLTLTVSTQTCADMLFNRVNVDKNKFYNRSSQPRCQVISDANNSISMSNLGWTETDSSISVDDSFAVCVLTASNGHYPLCYSADRQERAKEIMRQYSSNLAHPIQHSQNTIYLQLRSDTGNKRLDVAVQFDSCPVLNQARFKFVKRSRLHGPYYPIAFGDFHDSKPARKLQAQLYYGAWSPSLKTGIQYPNKSASYLKLLDQQTGETYRIFITPYNIYGVFTSYDTQEWYSTPCTIDVQQSQKSQDNWQGTCQMVFRDLSTPRQQLARVQNTIAVKQNLKMLFRISSALNRRCQWVNHGNAYTSLIVLGAIALVSFCLIYYFRKRATPS
jgi:hypothetical protein